MTEGKVHKIILNYSIPLLISMLFQQCFSIVDTIIAGKGIGMYAISAIGISFPITSILLSIATGLSSGSAIVVSQYFGAKKRKEMQESIYTALIATSLCSVFMMLIGYFTLDYLLQLLETPKEIYKDASIYLRIYYAQSFFLFMSNMCSSILIGMGDSKTPLYILMIASISNIFLDILFLSFFKNGIAGIAFATFVCQVGSCFLLFCFLMKKLHRMNLRKCNNYFSYRLLMTLLKYSIPTILQSSFVSVGNLFIQTLVNQYGIIVMASYALAIKLNTLVLSSIATFSNGLAGFVAQNWGAQKMNRIKEGYFFIGKLSVVLSIVISLFFLLFKDKVLLIFMADSIYVEQALLEGSLFFSVVSPFYVVVALKIATDSVLKGTGHMKAFMLATFADLFFRVSLSYFFSEILAFGSKGIWLAWPFGWSAGLIISFIFYKKMKL